MSLIAISDGYPDLSLTYPQKVSDPFIDLSCATVGIAQ